MKNFGTIIDNFDAVTKQYVDNQDALKLDKAGGSITGNLTVGGNLTINGTTTTVDSTTLQVKDKLIEVAHGNTTTLTTPAGLVAPKYDGTNSGALVFDSTGTAYVGDVTLKDGNIDVANSDLQPLATRTGLVGGNLVQYDSSAQTLNDSGKKISDLALKTDIPTNYVTTDTTQNNITGKKTFTNTIVKKSTTIDLNAKPTSGTQWNYIEFTDKNDDRIGIAGSRFDAGGYAGVYLQARNSQQLWIASSTPDSNGNTVTKTSTPTPPATDDSTQIANTSWVRTNYQEKGYAGIDGAVVNSDGKVTDKDGNVVDALYFKVASLTTTKAYMRTYLLAEVAMTNIVNEQSTVLIRCTTESSTSAPNVTITFDNYSYASLLLPKNIFVTADYKSGTAGATFTVWVKQDKNFMQQVWNVLSQNTRNYTTTSKREWRVFYSNITKATAVTDINAAPTGYTRIVANNNNRYSNLEENTYLWQQSQNAGITWKRYSDNTTRGVFRQNDNGTTATFVTQSDGFLFRPLDNNNTKSIKVDPKTGVLYPEKDLGADLGKTAQRWNNGYITNIKGCNVINDSGDNLTINGTTTVVTPPNKDNSNQVATTAWAGRRYKSIADFGFTSQTTVKAIVQKIIDNWYEYCTFACTNDDFNNFSDTPDGYGTLIIEVGSNALRPLISFTKQIGDSNSYKHWQANIVRGANNQVTEIQWYQIINDTLPQTISGAKTFTNNIVCSKNYPIIDLRHTLLTHGAYPTETLSNELRFLDKDDYYEGGIRFDTYTDGTQELKIMSRSFGTSNISGVTLRAKNKASSADEGGAWILHPSTDGSMDLGASSKRWRNGYITNLQNCKVINGGGGNSLIQQNSDTAGADITVGSTNCALKMLGKNARPTYRQGKNGTYANLALQSDIPFNTVGLSTGTLGSTKLPSAGRYYIECDHVNYSTFDVSTLVSCVLDFNNKNTTQTGVIVVGYVGGSAIHYYYILNIASTGLVTLSTMLDEQQGISGSFKYKKIN